MKCMGLYPRGNVVNEIQYDGLHRRIVKEVKNSADLDMTYHYYYNNQSIIEIHNGSEQVIQQFVWGAMYIDELVEIAVNDAPIGDSDFSENENFRGYYTQHNANFNVIGLTDAAGNLVERYEYTPYGQRQVFKVAGINDPDAGAPSHLSTRTEIAGVPQPYAINAFGHQGLLNDEATELVYNRARMLNPRLQRFNQRDPLGYVDGMSVYTYINSNPITLTDPSGQSPAVDPDAAPPPPPYELPDNLSALCDDPDDVDGCTKSGKDGWKTTYGDEDDFSGENKAKHARTKVIRTVVNPNLKGKSCVKACIMAGEKVHIDNYHKAADHYRKDHTGLDYNMRLNAYMRAIRSFTEFDAAAVAISCLESAISHGFLTVNKNGKVCKIECTEKAGELKERIQGLKNFQERFRPRVFDKDGNRRDMPKY